MRGIPVKVADAAEKTLNTPEGEMFVEYLVKAVGLTERTFIPDASGHVDPYRAAIKDGERAIVSLIVKLYQGETNDE